jgi:hypothetical protein
MQPVIFIARLIGPLFVVLGVGILLNQAVYTDMIGQAVLIRLPDRNAGVYRRLRHLNGYHAWTADWRVVIAILGWIMVIGGIVRIVLPAVTVMHAVDFYSGSSAMPIVAVIVLVVGVFLSYQRYFRKQTL